MSSVGGGFLCLENFLSRGRVKKRGVFRGEDGDGGTSIGLELFDGTGSDSGDVSSEGLDSVLGGFRGES